MAAPELLTAVEPGLAEAPILDGAEDAAAAVVDAASADTPRPSDKAPVTGTDPATPAASGKGILALAVHWTGVVLLSLAVLAVSALILLPRATGAQTYSVLTNSMAPKLAPGTFLVVAPSSFADLRSGDVVTYQLASGRPEVITHRIVGFSATQQGERTLITKGDNNGMVDPDAVREVQVRGKLLYAVPFAGYLANALGNTDRGLWVSVGAVTLIGYGIWNVAKVVRRNVAKRQRAQSKETIAGGDK